MPEQQRSLGKHVFTYPLTSGRQLAMFVYNAWGVVLPNRQICPNHSTPFRAFADGYFTGGPVVVWKASRGFGGKTHLLSTLGATLAVTQEAEVNILGGSGQQSRRVLETLDSLWGFEQAPRDLIVQPSSIHITRLASGAYIQALMASQKSVRGPHPQKLLLDEVDEMKLELLDAALGQPMTKRGVMAGTVCSSTHQHAKGTMTTMMTRARDRGWPFHEWCMVYDTRVATPAGDRPIGTLAAGDLVYAFEGGQVVERRVTDAWKTGRQKTVRVSVGEETIECTASHRFLLASGRWREAGRLRAGDVLRSVRPAQQDGASPVRLRQADAGGLGAVPRLLPVGSRKKEQREQGHDDARARDSQGRPRQGVVSGVDRGGTALRSRAAVLDEVPNGTVRLRLPLARPSCSGRGVRPLARAARGDRSRRRAREGRDSRRASPRGALVSATALVVAVTDGGFEDVYDITVESAGNFIAQGVVVHNCWRETMRSEANPYGWLEPSEVETKRATVPDSMWQTEFEGQEPNPESRAFHPDKVEAVFQGEILEGGYAGKLFEFETPKAHARYCHGADWARKVDRTVIATFRTDCTPARLVAYQAVRRMHSWPAMLKMFEDRMEKWGGSGMHDGTGLGDVMGAEGGFMRTDAIGEILAGRNRAELLSSYVAGFERVEFTAPKIDLLYDEHRYASVDDLYGTGKDVHLPDSVCACALAYKSGIGGWSPAWASA